VGCATFSKETVGACAKCLIGKHLANNLCHTEVPNCDSYSFEESGKCVECASDFVLTDTNTCVMMIENCRKHDREGKCSVCSKNYTLEHQKCHKSIENCTSFSDKEVGTCATCTTDHQLEHNLCHATVQSCTAYSTKTVGECKSCESSYVMVNNACYPETNDCAS